MKKQTILTPEEISVQLLDFSKINAELSENEELKAMKPKADGFKVAGGFSGLIEINGKACLVDWEFIAYEETPLGFHADVVPTYQPNPDGSQSFAMFATASFNLTREQIAESNTGKTVTLAEFTKERRGYNDRICRNEAGLCEWLSKV